MRELSLPYSQFNVMFSRLYFTRTRASAQYVFMSFLILLFYAIIIIFVSQCKMHGYLCLVFGQPFIDLFLDGGD